MDRPSRLPDEYETYLEAHAPRAPPMGRATSSARPCGTSLARAVLEAIDRQLVELRQTDVVVVVVVVVVEQIGNMKTHACTECVHQWRLEMRQMHTSWERAPPGNFCSRHHPTQPALRGTSFFDDFTACEPVLSSGSHSSTPAVLSHHRLARIKRLLPPRAHSRSIHIPHAVTHLDLVPARRPEQASTGSSRLLLAAVHRARARAPCGTGNFATLLHSGAAPARTARPAPESPPTCADTLGAALEVPVRRESRPQPPPLTTRGAADVRAACA